jgi:signal transduction histidine kinase
MADLYVPQTRGGRLIAVSRLFLASFSLLAVLLEPATPRESARFIHVFLGAYVLFALLLVARAWRRPVPPRYRLTRHVIDMVTAFVFWWASGGSNSLLFAFFVFLLVAGGLCWQRRGTLWTAVAILGAVLGGGAYEALVSPETFDLYTLITRGVSLVVTAALLGGIGVYERWVRGEIQELSSEPDIPLGNRDALLRSLLQWAARIMGAQRVVAVWQEKEEPWAYLASWQRGQYEYTREPPGVFEPVVAHELTDTSFLCGEVNAPSVPVLRPARGGFIWRYGDALHPKFCERFSITSVLSVPVRADTVEGRLFFLDQIDEARMMTSDDLVLGDIIAHRVGSWLNRIHLTRRLAEVAALEERIRVARDLHDGAFHSLTGAALEVARLLRMPRIELPEAQDRLRDIQQSLADGQRMLRLLISSLKETPSGVSDPGVGLEVRLKEFCRWIERQSALRVDESITRLGTLAAGPSNDVYFFIREALTNVARHAQASTVRLEVTVENARVRIAVADDGRGFPFKGRYDHAALVAQKLGPATLKARAALLGGAVTIDSSDQGTKLEIIFPVELPAH